MICIHAICQARYRIHMFDGETTYAYVARPEEHTAGRDNVKQGTGQCGPLAYDAKVAQMQPAVYEFVITLGLR